MALCEGMEGVGAVEKGPREELAASMLAPRTSGWSQGSWALPRVTGRPGKRSREPSGLQPSM